MDSPAVHFDIAAWSFYDPIQERPELPQVPALLRRRASAADRMALKAAFDAFPETGSIATVFCSRHGEVHRSVELMEMMARGEGQLPMSFSLSVHNAASGLFSIARGDFSASTSLAAGKDTLAMGVFEACSLLDQGQNRVLLVDYDDALPQSLKGYADEKDQPFALALLLRGGDAFSLRHHEPLAVASARGGDPMGLRLANFLKSGEPMLDTGDFRWSRR